MPFWIKRKLFYFVSSDFLKYTGIWSNLMQMVLNVENPQMGDEIKSTVALRNMTYWTTYLKLQTYSCMGF